MKVSRSYIAAAAAKTNAFNLVAAINFDYRALDSLCVIALFFGMVIGTIAILRETGRIRNKEENNDK